MKLKNLILLIALLVAASACSLGGEHTEARIPFNPADWPTPLPATVEPEPTPFPKEAVELLAQKQAAAPTLAIAALPTATAIPAPTVTPEPTSVATPLLTGAVTGEGLNVRSGPGQGYALVSTLKQGDVVEVLARETTYGWVNVKTTAGEIGWVNPYFLKLSGDLGLVDGLEPQPVSASAGITATTAQPAPGKPAATTETMLIQLRSGGDIMLINSDGTGLRRLTTGIDPALSPDGSRIAFTRWDGAGMGTVWVINADGSNEHPVMSEIRQVKSPSWSPDSRQIAVNFQEGGILESHQECYNVSKNGGTPDINYWQAYDITTKVEFDSKGRPQVFVCWMLPPDAHWKLRVIDAVAGGYRDMPAGQYAFSPTWDPANTWRVVSTAGKGLVATDINRGEAFPLTDDPSDRSPRFSPDGRYLAVTYRQDTHWEVHRLNADGGGRVRLTKTPLYAVVDSPTQWNNAAPVFSPDVSEIAFLTDRAGRWEVWVMGADGSNQRPMFSDAVNDQLPIEYLGNDERSLGWGK